eukprot:TCONS_00027924-protein
MKKYTNIIFIPLLLYGLNVITSVHGAANCIALSEGCGCHLDDGSGKFDLTPMTKLKPPPMFDNLQDQFGNTILVDMCRDFEREQVNNMLKTMNNLTASISAKVFVATAGASIAVGKEMSYEYDGTVLTVVYTYTEPTTGTKMQTRVVMHCSTEDGLGTFSQIETGAELQQFSGTLSSKYGCVVSGGGGGSSGKNGISTGTILCIVLLVLIIVYMVSGILINKYVRKVEKGDEFPNKNFWKDFPGLIKDGFAFTYHQIRRKDAYESI